MAIIQVWNWPSKGNFGDRMGLNIVWDTIETPDSWTSEHLQSKEDQESDHQTEETHSFGKGETQNGVWEKLTLEGWVTGITDDQWAEHCSDTWKILLVIALVHGKVSRKLILVGLLTSTRSSNTDGGGTSTNELGGSINISVLDGDREWAKNILLKNNSKYWNYIFENRNLPDSGAGSKSWGGEDNSVHVQFLN